MGWSGLPLSAGDDVRSAALINQFIAAIRERYAIVELGNFNYTRYFPRTIDPDNLPSGSNNQKAYAGTQNSSVTNSAAGATKLLYKHNGSSWQIAADQTAGADVLSVTSSSAVCQEGDYLFRSGTAWRAVQGGAAALAISGRFVDKATYPDGFDGVADFPILTAGLGTILTRWQNFWNTVTGHSPSATNTAGFTRHYPLTVKLSAPPTGTTGQRAFEGDQNSGTLHYIHDIVGDIYEWNGSSWVLSDDQTSSVTILESFGGCNAGDYIDHLFVNEIYDVLNVLTWSYATAGTNWEDNPNEETGAEGGLFHQQGNLSTSPSAAYASCEGYWDDEIDTDGGGGELLSGIISKYRDNFNPHYDCEAYSCGRDIVMGVYAGVPANATIPTTQSHDAELYLKFDFPVHYVSGGQGEAFDGSNIDLDTSYQGKYALWDSITNSTDTNHTTEDVHDPTDFPSIAVVADPPSGGGFTSTAAGYEMIKAYYLIKWENSLSYIA